MLDKIMSCDQPRKSRDLHAALVCGMLTVGLVPFGASGQTGAVAAQTMDDQATLRVDVLVQLKNQPQLEEHLDRINEFRAILRNGGSHQPAPTADPKTMRHAGANASQVIPTDDTVAETDAQKLAILELEMSISARKGPSTLYPGAGLVMALQKISNWSNKHMIDALRNGGRPIYSNLGHLIGVEDPASGRLLGGRKS
ncbi:MAG: hypothetical protein VX013_01695 [Pseudomonadota bacterium]|nr:hypothetical protein [Pseudomonadota bacterium]